MAPQKSHTATVLVVDDDPSVLATYRRLLERCGLRAVAEPDPRTVLDGARIEGQVDLLLIDYKMPGMNGLSFLAELRRRECMAPCILVSAFVNDDVRIQARNLGVSHVIEKPVDVCALRAAIAELLPVRSAAKPTLRVAF